MLSSSTWIVLVLIVYGSGATVPDFGPAFVPSNEDNMNGDYVFSTTPGGKPGLFPKRYADYPGGVEYYDVYSPPITTLYSQVWWAPLDPTPLPDEMVKKYAGKGMAIVGWEIDQVRRTPKGDVSVPISASYNHHYTSQLVGAKARFRKVKADGPNSPLGALLLKQSGHGMVSWDQEHYLVEEVESSTIPTSQAFSSANGGEYRKTYHGFSPGYALVIDSPSSFQLSPMQIDTWNRDAMNISGPLPPRFVPGPLPRSSLAPENPQYSGLLECPMTTRVVKVIDGTYVVHNQGSCTQPILTSQECFNAAATLLSAGDTKHTFVNNTKSDPKQPAGCSASVDAKSPLSINVLFNTGPSNTTCATDVYVVVGTTDSLVSVSVSLNAETQLVELTLQGPSSVWYGVGFGARGMPDAPWTIVIDGYGNVSEHKLGDHSPGMILNSTVTVLSNAVNEGLRTVVLTRALKGANSDYFTFSVAATDATIPIIVAYGSGPDFAYHKDKTPTSITFFPLSNTGAGACVCPENPKPFGSATGSLVYHSNTTQPEDTGSGAVGFGANKCADWPFTDLINQTNPTCDIRNYHGGQWACHHMWALLDSDQEIPWVDQPLVLHHKYRFWVQPYNSSYHTQLVLGESAGSALLIGSPWEYDVPKCDTGVTGCSMQDGTWIHTVKGNTMGHHTFAALNFHCHAPTCLSMAVYACPIGTSLGDCNEAMGKLICLQKPVYAGSGNPSIDGTRFGEVGYIAIPDCFWGGEEFGLEPPINLEGVPLHMIKTSNATYGHYGEMSGGQPWVY